MRFQQIACVAISLLASASAASGHAGDLLLQIENPELPTKAGDDLFATAIVIDDNYLAAGAPSDDPLMDEMDDMMGAVSNAGSVYLIDRKTGQAVKDADGNVHSIPNPHPVEADQFGSSIAILTIQGRKVLAVGVPGADFTADPSNPPPPNPDLRLAPTRVNAGAVYIMSIAFNPDGTVVPAQTGDLLLTIVPPTRRTNANFGAVLYAHGEGLIIGVPGDDPQNINDAGTVFLYRFELTPTGDVAVRNKLTIENPFFNSFGDPLNKNLNNGDRFGASVVSREGIDIVVGTPLYDRPAKLQTGRVYVFRPGMAFTPDERFDGDGKTPALPLLPRLTIDQPTLTSEDTFGATVAASPEEIIVGAPGFDAAGALNAGRAYTFDAALANTPGDAVAPLRTFPSAVTPLPDPDQEAAGLGTFVAASPSFIAMSAPGRDIAGGPNAGTVYIISPGTDVVKIDNPDPARDESFGSRLFADGSVLAIGAPNDAQQIGALYLFSVAGVNLLPPKVKNPELPTLLSTADNFGSAIASLRRPDGRLDLIIGANNDDPLDQTDSGLVGVPNAGSAYLHHGETGDLLLAMHNPSPIFNAFFGLAVTGVDRPPGDPRGGQDILVGAMRNFEPRGGGSVMNSLESGAGYLFDPEGPGTPEIVFMHPEVASAETNIEHYGAQVLGVGQKVIISSMFGDARTLDGYGEPTVRNTGAVYILDRANPHELLPTVIQDPFPFNANQFGGNTAKSIAVVPRADGAGFDLLISSHLHDYGTISNAGRAYLFDGVTHELLLTINNPTPQNGEQFGFNVAAIGTKLIIASPNDFSDPDGPGGNPPSQSVRTGAVYVFDGTQRDVARGGTVVGGAIAPSLFIADPAPVTDGGFGMGLAVLGEDIVVGAAGSSGPDGLGGIATNAGAVYAFDGRDGTHLGPRLENPDRDDPDLSKPRASDSFGSFICAVGGRFAVAAANDDLTRHDEALMRDVIDTSAGAVYLYDWDSVPPVLTLSGPRTMKVKAIKGFTEPGYAAHDERPRKELRAAALQAPIDLTGEVVVTGSVDLTRKGTYELRYTVKDLFGNSASAIRTVRVVGAGDDEGDQD